MDKLRNPIEITTAKVLTGTLALANATATKLGGMTEAFVWVDYTRNGGSVTGRPVLAVEISRDPPDTLPAAVTHFSRVALGDGSGITMGEVEMYYEALGFPTTSGGTYHWPSICVAGAHWMRVYIADKDAAAPGVASVYLTGGA